MSPPYDRGAPLRRSPPALLNARSILLFALAAVAEISGAWLTWPCVREHRGRP